MFCLAPLIDTVKQSFFSKLLPVPAGLVDSDPHKWPASSLPSPLERMLDHHLSPFHARLPAVEAAWALATHPPTASPPGLGEAEKRVGNGDGKSLKTDVEKGAR